MTWNPSLCNQVTGPNGEWFLVVPTPLDPALNAWRVQPFPDGVPVLAGPDGDCACLQFDSEDAARAVPALAGLWSEDA